MQSGSRTQYLSARTVEDNTLLMPRVQLRCCGVNCFVRPVGTRPSPSRTGRGRTSSWGLTHAVLTTQTGLHSSPYLLRRLAYISHSLLFFCAVSRTVLSSKFVKITIAATVSKTTRTFCGEFCENSLKYNYRNSGRCLSSCLLFKTQRFGDWILSPFSGGTYSVSGVETMTSSVCWAQLSKFHLKTEIECSLRNVVF
jgi:hypothetical protein